MLQLTEERVIPDQMKPMNGLLLEHLARYHFALPYLKGRVLDFACGSGYGTHSMAKIAKKRLTEVVGIDVSPEAIKYAKHNYFHPLTTYEIANVIDPSLPETLGRFDVIVSFETIEHVYEEEQFLSNIHQMLKPEGVLILSTPFGQGRGKPCGSPFHVHQFTREEFFGLFKEYREQKFFFQKGVLVVPKSDSNDYPIGIAVCRK